MSIDKQSAGVLQQDSGERALLSSGYIKQKGGQRHRGAVSTRGATSIFTEQFFEDLSPSYSLKTFLSLFF